MSVKSVGVAITTAILLLTGSCEDKNGPTQPDNNNKKKAYGAFDFYIDQARNSITFIGKLRVGPMPVAPWDTVMTSDECALIVPRETTCQVCDSLGENCVDNCDSPGEVCVSDNNCQHEPDTMTAGSVTVTGMKNRAGTETSTLKLTNGNYQPEIGNIDSRPPSKPLTNPPFTEGGTLTVTASGNESVAGFTLSAKTINKIEISADTVAMDSGKDIHLTWKAPANQADSRMLLSIDVSYHGGTKALIVGNCLDDGDLTIPGKMLDSLKTYGLAGHPKLELIRQSTGENSSTGVQLFLKAYTLLWLKIPGLTSCSTDGVKDNCPSGYTCKNQMCVEE